MSGATTFPSLLGLLRCRLPLLRARPPHFSSSCLVSFCRAAEVGPGERDLLLDAVRLQLESRLSFRTSRLRCSSINSPSSRDARSNSGVRSDCRPPPRTGSLGVGSATKCSCLADVGRRPYG